MTTTTSPEYKRGRLKGLQEIQETGNLWRVTVRMAKRLAKEGHAEERNFWQGYLDSKA